MRPCALALLIAAILVTCLAVLSQRATVPKDMLPAHLASGVLVFEPYPAPGQAEHFRVGSSYSCLALDLGTLQANLLPRNTQLMGEDGTWGIIETRGKQRIVVVPDDLSSAVPPGATEFARTQPLHPYSRTAIGLTASEGTPQSPATSTHGDQAYITKGEDNIRLHRLDGSDSTLRGPGTRISHLQWTPDGDCLLYTYANEAWKTGPLAGKTDAWALGLLDVRTGHHYRVVPGTYSGLGVEGAMRRGKAQCVRQVKPELAERLWDVHHTLEREGRAK